MKLHLENQRNYATHKRVFKEMLLKNPRNQQNIKCQRKCKSTQNIRDSFLINQTEIKQEMKNGNSKTYLLQIAAAIARSPAVSGNVTPLTTFKKTAYKYETKIFRNIKRKNNKN